MKREEFDALIREALTYPWSDAMQIDFVVERLALGTQMRTPPRDPQLRARLEKAHRELADAFRIALTEAWPLLTQDHDKPPGLRVVKTEEEP